MIPKTYFEKQSIPVIENEIFAILPSTYNELQLSCLEKAAKTMKFKYSTTFQSENSRSPSIAWEKIKKAELVIADVSDGDPEVLFQAGIALTIKDEDNILILCRQEDNKELSHTTDQFSMEAYQADDLEKLTDIIKMSIESIQKKRKGTTELPNFKQVETKRIFDNAIKARRGEDWETAEILFEKANEKESGHWYLLTQWGVMYREKRAWQKAEEMFRDAIENTRYDDEKAHIYMEKAIMYQKADRFDDADSWFQKAQATDNKNPKLYFAWAQFWDEVGNAQNALSKVVQILSEIDDKNQDAKNRMEYYTRKVADPKYSRNFKEFMDEKNGPKGIKRPSSRFGTKISSTHDFWGRPVEDLLKYGPGKVVTGIVNNVVPFGVFLSFPQGHNGLIFKDDLNEGWQRRYFKGQRVKVKIKDIRKEPDGRLATDLIPYSR